MARFANILETVGNTPVVRINKLAPEGVSTSTSRSRPSTPSAPSKLTASPSASSRTPSAPEPSKPGQTVVEATSGNTGIGLAMVCAAREATPS